MADMTPERAREVQLRILKHGVGFDDIEEMRRSLDTLAAMRVEHDHGVVDWEEVDGRYEVYHHTRLVGEWRAT